MSRNLIGAFAAAGVLALGAGALAEGLTRLPQAYQFPRSEKSPGAVTFRHKTHVQSGAPDCSTCHPRLFKINQAGATANGAPIQHAVMKKGAQCGACHDGDKAFGLDDCEQCHEAE